MNGELTTHKSAIPIFQIKKKKNVLIIIILDFISMFCEPKDILIDNAIVTLSPEGVVFLYGTVFVQLPPFNRE